MNISCGGTDAKDDLFDDLLTDFLDESGQLLESLNENMMSLESWIAALTEGEDSRFDDDLMNELFRAAHSFKGLSAMLGFADINRLTHTIENVFDAARNETLQIDSKCVDMVFQALDRLEGMVSCLRDASLPRVSCDDVIDGISNFLDEMGARRKQTSQAEAEQALATESVRSEDAISAELNAVADLIAAESATSVATDESASAVNAPDVGDWKTRDYFQDITDEEDAPVKYLAIFIDEADISLDELADTLETISFPVEPSTVQMLLVTSHRLKGSAASIGLHRPAKLAHLMEDVLQRVRDEDGPFHEAIVAAMIACVDALRVYIDGLKSGNSPPDEFNDLANALTCLCKVTEAKAQTDMPLVASNETGEVHERTRCEQPKLKPAEGQSLAITAKARITDDFQKIADEEWTSGTTGLLGAVQFQPDMHLPGMKAHLLVQKLQQVGQLVACQPEEEQLADIEDIIGFQFGIESEASADEVRQLLSVGGVASVQVENWSSDDADRKAAVPPPEPTVITTNKASTESSAKQPAERPVQKQSGNNKSKKPAETLRVEVDRLDHLMNLAGQLVINKARFSQLGDQLKLSIDSNLAQHATNNAEVTIRKITEELEPVDAGHASEPTMNAVRSHVVRLQQDMETITSELQHLNAARIGVADLFEAIHQLERVSDDIQSSVMDTRMIPIGPLFNRFKRVIRDISKSNHKEIDLVILGEKTELDKRMIDGLSDPLIHMVRNSADHGIGLPEERIASGKPRRGTVTLNAFQRGNSVVVEVTDDGKGIDVQSVRDKAISRGLISEADAERITNHQLFQLIWQPGFTTAKQVTDVSGRGMGMDIVRSKIEDLNGCVELDSEPGVGTRFTVQLPLTLAILPSLMACIDGEVFAMPLESVVEIVSVSANNFATVQGVRTARVRGRVVSVSDLAEVFSWGQPPKQDSYRERREQNDVILIIVGDREEELAITVDSLLGEEDIVIKSLAENYHNVEGIAGASILGDGRVALILDIVSAIHMAKQHAVISHQPSHHHLTQVVENSNEQCVYTDA